jgi:hypothetical protein
LLLWAKIQFSTGGGYTGKSFSRNETNDALIEA